MHKGATLTRKPERPGIRHKTHLELRQRSDRFPVRDALCKNKKARTESALSEVEGNVRATQA